MVCYRLFKVPDCWLLLPCAGNSLITLTFHLLNQYGLVELFQLDMVKLWRFLVMVQEDYHSDNPYHNAVHAADVTQAMYCYMQEPKVSGGLIIASYQFYWSWMSADTFLQSAGDPIKFHREGEHCNFLSGAQTSGFVCKSLCPAKPFVTVYYTLGLGD